MTNAGNQDILRARTSRETTEPMDKGESMSEASSRKLSATQVVSDIRSGMSDSDLMKKYELKEKQLAMLLGKLVERGHLSGEELDRRSSRQSVEPEEAKNNKCVPERGTDYVEAQEHAAPHAESAPVAASAPKRHSALMVGVLCLIVPAAVVTTYLFLSVGRKPRDVTTAPRMDEQVIVVKRGAGGGELRHVRAATQERKPKKTALMQAAKKGDVARVTDLLAQGVDVNEKGGKGWTALSVAAYRGRGSVVSLLLEKGADIETKNRAGWTPLICAASKGHKDVVELLLTHKADPNAISKIGVTALNAAAAQGHADTVRLLLDRGAEVNLAREGDVRPALHRAMQHKRSDVVKLLLQRDAQFKPDDKEVTDFVIHACKQGDLETLRMLVSKGADVNAFDKVGDHAPVCSGK